MSERQLSGVAATRRGMHARLAALDPDRKPSYDPRRTLRVRVEFVRQIRRRRTQIVFGLLLVLPIIIALSFEIGGGSGAGSALVNLATAGAANFALFSEFATVGFLLVVVVALFFGDTVASEASWSSLRYLLAQPVPRSRLLRQKLIVAAILAVSANLLLPLWSYLVGGVFFGWAPAESPLGGTLGFGEAAWRILGIVAFVSIDLMIVGSLAFLLSVSVDNPLGAVGGAVMFNVVSSILDQITALGTMRHYLPTHWDYAWTDLLQSPVDWADMMRGVGLAMIYSAIFLSVAWLRFDRKDITS